MPLHIVPISLILLLGLALIVLAVPRTVAAWKGVQGLPALDKMKANETPTAAQLTTCVEAYTGSLRWVQASFRLFNLGTCEFEIALAKPLDDPERGEWLKRAEQSTFRGLVANPAETVGWSRLAFIRHNRHAAGRDVVAPLIMSLDTGPTMRPLWRGRTWLMLLYAPQMTVEELLTVRFQLKTIWTYGPSERPHLLEAAHNLDRLYMVLWALRDDPEAMAEFETMERNSRF